MHRQLLLSQLEKCISETASDPAKEVIEFVRREPNCFSRHCPEGHITGSAWLLNPAQDKVLLTYHRKLNKWLQLGGHAENETDMLQVALREAHEESGIDNIQPISDAIFDVDIHVFPARGEEPEHLHYDICYLLQANTEKFTISAESKALAWVSFDEIIQLHTDRIKRMAQKCLDCQITSSIF